LNAQPFSFATWEKKEEESEPEKVLAENLVF